MVAAISEAPPRQNSPSRRPLLVKDKDNGGFVAPRKPKSKQVSSRYMSPSTSTTTTTSTSTSTTTNSSSSSRRCASPLLSRSSNSTPIGPNSKRAQSADRRRPAASPPAQEVSAAAKMLITSTRRLSVSFQGEGFSIPISKAKEAPSLSIARKATPERRRATPLRGGGGGDQPVVVDQLRWPARTRPSPNQLSRSSDYGGDDRRKLPGIGSGMVARALQQSVACDGARRSFDGRLSLDLGNAERLSSVQKNPLRQSVVCDGARQSFDGGLSLDLGNADRLSSVQQNPDGNSTPFDVAASDTDSVSSGSTSGVQEGLAGGKGLPRGIAVSARFWQETNSRLRRLQDPGSPLSTSPGSRMGASSKFVQSKKFGDSPLSSPRGIASPTRGAVRAASPSKLWTSSTTSSPLRGNPSPSKARNSLSGPSSSSVCSTPSILSFSVDLRRGKMGENRIFDAHMLRLHYNRQLQWRFVNARADATSMAQKLNAEKNLWNAWVAISELRHSVTLKRIKLLLLRKKLKLASILREQMNALEEWAVIDRDHSNSLMGVTEALRASTLRLPINGKAIADIQNLKDAVGSAVDVVHAMASTICSLSSKVEGMNCLILELANVTTKEQNLLQQCKDFMSTLSSMQVKDCSLRTHILQLSRVSSASTGLATTRV